MCALLCNYSIACNFKYILTVIINSFLCIFFAFAVYRALTKSTYLLQIGSFFINVWLYNSELSIFSRPYCISNTYFVMVLFLSIKNHSNISDVFSWRRNFIFVNIQYWYTLFETNTDEVVSWIKLNRRLNTVSIFNLGFRFKPFKKKNVLSILLLLFHYSDI